jgi:outer membrane protein
MKFLFKMIFFSWILLGFSQEKTMQSFTLEEAISQAQTNNYSVKNATKDYEIAQKKKWETIAMGLPQLSGSLSYQNTLDFQEQGAAANAFNPIADPDDIALFAFGTKHVGIANLTLSQLIFDGSYLVGVQSTKTYLQITQNAITKTQQEIKEAVINTYCNILLANENILVLQKNKTILEKLLKDTNQIYKNGFIEEENVEQLQITLNSLQDAIDNVSKQKEIATNMLKLIMGINIEEPITLTDNLEVLTQKNIANSFENKAFNPENNIDYIIGKNLETSQKMLLKLERSRALPSIGLQFNTGYNAFTNQFTFFNTNQPWNFFANVGVGMNIPIFSSGKSGARIQQAKFEIEKAQTQLTETEQKLKLQYQQAQTEFDFAVKKYNTAKSNLQLAERIEKKQQIKFKEGLSTSFDFTDAQKQLYSAQQEMLNAMLQIITKKASLEKLTN